MHFCVGNKHSFYWERLINIFISFHLRHVRAVFLHLFICVSLYFTLSFDFLASFQCLVNVSGVRLLATPSSTVLVGELPILFHWQRVVTYNSMSGGESSVRSKNVLAEVVFLSDVSGVSRKVV